MILDLLFPNRCLNCSRITEPEEILCAICNDKISFTHHRFSEPNELLSRCRTLFPTEQAAALMNFEKDGLSRKLIHDLKYRHREKIGKYLAELCLEKLDVENISPNLIATVPLHPKKEKERGYNQLHKFADTLSKQTGIPVDHQLIRRNQYKKAQALKDRAHRSETASLFSMTKSIENQHILLVDDVFTTGNTMATVAWEILKSGNNKVSVLVMAMD